MKYYKAFHCITQWSQRVKIFHAASAAHWIPLNDLQV